MFSLLIYSSLLIKRFFYILYKCVNIMEVLAYPVEEKWRGKSSPQSLVFSYLYGLKWQENYHLFTWNKYYRYFYFFSGKHTLVNWLGGLRYFFSPPLFRICWFLKSLMDMHWIKEYEINQVQFKTYFHSLQSATVFRTW